MRKGFVGVLSVLLVLPSLLFGRPVTAAESEFPDLQTLPPTDLRFDSVTIDGSTHRVLRFSNVVWNAGQGPMDLRGVSSTTTKRTKVYQRVYDTSGSYVSQSVGEFTFHPEHNHFHFEGFSRFELWTKATWDAWLASGRTQGAPYKVSPKNTSCVMDMYMVRRLANTPSDPAYDSICGTSRQGLSVGWGDLYRYTLYGQWIDLGTSQIPDNTYVLRSVADPDNRLFESSARGAQDRESHTANEAVTYFRVSKGAISLDTTAPAVTAPAARILSNSVLGPSSIPATISWTGSDALSGVARYELQRRVNGGSYGGVRLPRLTATSVTPASYSGRTYEYRVRAVDRAGNIGAWKVGSSHYLSAFQETGGVTYTGPWTASTTTSAYGGALRYSDQTTATATRTLTGSQIAFVSHRSPSGGVAEVYVDQVKLATIDLYAAADQWRRVVYAKQWNASAAHTITVRVTGTKHAASTSRRVAVDAFVALR